MYSPRLPHSGTLRAHRDAIWRGPGISDIGLRRIAVIA